MSGLKVWSRTISQKIEENSEELHRKDFKFFKLDRFQDIAERTDGFSGKCRVCKNNKQEIEDITDKFVEYLNGSPRDRSIYEKRTEKIVSHLKKEHHLSQAEYFTSSYSLFGIIIGTLLGALIGYLFHPLYAKIGALIGFPIGIIIGRILGKIKDKKQKDAGLIL